MPLFKNIGIVGSRKWPSKRAFLIITKAFLRTHTQAELLISGGAPEGIDFWVENLGWPYEHELPAHKYPKEDARYAPFHVANFHIRNKKIVTRAELVLAFQYQNSSGTQSSIDQTPQDTPLIIIPWESLQGIPLGKSVLTFQDAHGVIESPLEIEIYR